MAVRLNHPIQRKKYRLKASLRPGSNADTDLRRFRKPLPRTAVPSFFTLMNLFSGFVSLMMVADGNLRMGAVLIILAAFFDSLDGIMARLANAESEFGMELDSISDVVSFGVAPGFLAYHLCLSDLQVTGLIISALPALCGAVRLARYNVDNKAASLPQFKGLPIPAQAIIIAAFVLTFLDREHWFDGFQMGMTSVMLPIIIILSLLMVSVIPFDKVPKLDRESLRENRAKLIPFTLYGLLILVLQEYGLMAAFSLYILKGVVLGAWSIFFEPVGRTHDGHREENPDQP